MPETLQPIARHGNRSPVVHRATPCFILFCGFIFLAACSTVTNLPAERLSPPLSGKAAALVEPGPFDYLQKAGEHHGEHGCTMAYETYHPARGTGETMVLLAHGFLRDLETMRGWAEHWASHGVAVAVVSLCNSTPFAGHHERNAADMIALAAKLHDGPLLYAGFSAGGLAAHIAAAHDTRTTAYLGLDGVEHGGLARAAVPESNYPALLLVAEPSSCNRRNNMLDATSGMTGYRAIRIRHSTHCHFEDPYDSRCEIACGSVRPSESQTELIETVRSIATAWILQNSSEAALPAQGDVLSGAANGEWRERVDIIR